MSSDYVDYYHRVKEFGKKQKWDEKKINQMLGDRQGFEREFRMVSGVSIWFWNGLAESFAFCRRIILIFYFIIK